MRIPVPPLLAISEAEWRALITKRPNVLLERVACEAEQILQSLGPHLLAPLYAWHPPAELWLPPDRRGSLILFEVSALFAEQQTHLLDWMQQTDGPAMQVICTTTARPLFTLIEHGQFRVDLYYRLNTMRVECASLGVEPFRE